MRGKTAVFIMTAALLTGVIGFCSAMTAKGQEREPDICYQPMEAELLKDMRGYLDLAGFRNSGVTLTRVVDEAGCREYTFMIHHQKIDQMESREREELQARLSDFCRSAAWGFPDQICSFRQEFLILEDAR